MAQNNYERQVQAYDDRLVRLRAARDALTSTRSTVTAAQDTFRAAQSKALDGDLVQHIRRPRRFEGRAANDWASEYRDARIEIDARARNAAGFINALQPQINRINALISETQVRRMVANSNAQKQRNSGG